MSSLEKAVWRVEYIGTEIVTCPSDQQAFAAVVEAARAELRRIRTSDPAE